MNYIDVFALVPEENNIVVRLWEDTNKPMKIKDQLYSQIFEAIHNGNLVGYYKLEENTIITWLSWKTNNMPVGYISFTKTPFKVQEIMKNNIQYSIQKIKSELEILDIQPPEIKLNTQPNEQILYYYVQAIIAQKNEIPAQKEEDLYNLVESLANNAFNLWPLNTAIVPKISTNEEWIRLLIQPTLPQFNEEEKLVLDKTLNTLIQIIIAPVTIQKLIQISQFIYNYYENNNPKENIYKALQWIENNFSLQQATIAFQKLNEIFEKEPREITKTIITYYSSYLRKNKLSDQLRLLNGNIALLLTEKELPIELKKELLKTILLNAETLGTHDLLSTIENLSEIYSQQENKELQKEIIEFIENKKQQLTNSLEACISISKSLQKLGENKKAIQVKIKAIPFYENDPEFLRLNDEILSGITKQFFTPEENQAIYNETGKNLATLIKTRQDAQKIVDHIFNQAQQHNNLIAFEHIIIGLIQNSPPELFDQISEYALNKIKETPALYSLNLKLTVQKFEKALKQNQFEQSITLLRKLFNEIDFEDPQYEKLLTDLSATLITAAIQNNYPPAIEEVKTRISLIFGEKSNETIYKILLKSSNQIIQQKQIKNPLLLYSILSFTIQTAKQLKKTENLLSLIDNTLKITANTNLKTQYLETLSQKIELYLQEGKPLSNIYLDEIQRLVETNNIEITKLVLDKALKEFANNLEIKRKIFELLLQYPDDIKNKLLTPSEILEYRKTLALIKGEAEGTQQTINEFIEGINDLTKRGDHELVRQFVLDAVKFARTSKTEKEIPKFLNAFMPSFKSSIEAYKKSKSPLLYKDLYKNLHQLLNEIYLAKEGIEIFNLGSMLAKANIECAEQKLTQFLKEKTPLTPTKTKIVLKFIYQAMQLIDELAVIYKTLHPAINNDEIFNQFIKVYQEAAKLYTAITNAPETLTIKILTAFLVKHEAYTQAIEHVSQSHNILTRVKKFPFSTISQEDSWAIIKSWQIIAAKSEEMTQQEFKQFLETIEKNIDNIKKPWKKNKIIIKQLEHLQLKITKSLQATPQSINSELELLSSIIESTV